VWDQLTGQVLPRGTSSQGLTLTPNTDAASGGGGSSTTGGGATPTSVGPTPGPTTTTG